jgi:hypothetical protein
MYRVPGSGISSLAQTTPWPVYLSWSLIFLFEIRCELSVQMTSLFLSSTVELEVDRLLCSRLTCMFSSPLFSSRDTVWLMAGSPDRVTSCDSLHHYTIFRINRYHEQQVWNLKTKTVAESHTITTQCKLGRFLLVSGTSVSFDSGSCDNARFCAFIRTGTAQHTANCAWVVVGLCRSRLTENAQSPLQK